MIVLTNQLFDLNECDFKDIFAGTTYPWEILAKLKIYISDMQNSIKDNYERVEEFVWIGKGSRVEKTAMLKGPAIIGCNCEIRHAAYIRENVLIGNEVIIGNSSEIKNSLLFNRAQAPHFNYIGDSILGYRAHLGAGAIVSNLKSNKDMISVKVGEDRIDTGLRKFGALIGDYAEVGCNSVINPGSIIGRESIIYPLTSVRGSVPEGHILKGNGEIVPRR